MNVGAYPMCEAMRAPVHDLEWKGRCVSWFVLPSDVKSDPRNTRIEAA